MHTFSIVAHAADSGELGVAVQSHWFHVGAVVPWVEAGVGAVATQSFTEPAYGPRLLALLSSGLRATEALDALIAADPGREVRQVAVVDGAGQVAVHTGARCIPAAGHHIGDGYGVQANMMLSDAVVPAMASAYEAARGPLAERLVAALEAAQAAGGDIRGQQSAALVVVKARATDRPWTDRLVDLRVDDHTTPVAELGRLLGLHRAYEHMGRGDQAMERGDMNAALRHYQAAAELAPAHLEIAYWHAVALATNGWVDAAMPLFRQVFAAEPGWMELTGRLHVPGIIPGSAEGRALVERILREAGPEPPR
ncbi:MAG TPA: DUF1028 domain-containing protein [Haliangium sp.]|nr:DUF1028 domain-containing protein [Haliangium sp.]